MPRVNGSLPLRALVAVDGSQASRGAVRAAAAFADAGLIVPEVIAVDPIDLTATGGIALDVDEAIEARLGSSGILDWRGSVQADLFAGGGGNWPIHLRAGAPVYAVIAGEAERGRFDLVMVGLRHRGLLAQLTRRDTARRIVESTDVAVLSVAAGFAGVPNRIVVGVDFGDASERAAQAAARMLGKGATLTLAFVDLSLGEPTEVIEGYERLHDQGFRVLMEQLTVTLTVPPGARVEHVRLSGTPATTLLALADRTDSDLIAVGRQRTGLARTLLGSVAGDLLRDGRRSVLVASRVPLRRREA